MKFVDDDDDDDIQKMTDFNKSQNELSLLEQMTNANVIIIQ